VKNRVMMSLLQCFLRTVYLYVFVRLRACAHICAPAFELLPAFVLVAPDKENT
jgi:hypothetical protein